MRDFDATLARAAASGTPPLTPPLGEAGQRRVCVRDPEGVLIEILEEDIRDVAPRARPRPEVPATVRFVTASVPDLDLARRFWVDGLGLPEARDLELHTAAHEQLWGLPGAERRSLLLWANDLLVELVQYTDPPGRPWPPNYYISDQGLLNVAFGFRTRRELQRALRAAEAAGATPNWTVLETGNWGVVYVNDGHASPALSEGSALRPAAPARASARAVREPCRGDRCLPDGEAAVAGRQPPVSQHGEPARLVPREGEHRRKPRGVTARAPARRRPSATGRASRRRRLYADAFPDAAEFDAREPQAVLPRERDDLARHREAQG